MKIHRFIGDFNLTGKEVDITDPENIKQIKAVLRMEVGDELILSDGIGAEARVKIIEISKSKMVCEVLETKKTEESDKTVSLYLAILKKENFELAVQKAVECGVAQIIPVITERTVKVGLNMERLEKIIKEASEQSGRSILPKLFETMNFVEALEHGKENQEKVIFHLVDTEYLPEKNASSVSIFVGPEGGFNESEVNLAKESGYTVASLGTLTLRGETAAIVATYRAVQGI
ncbi:MAG: 16S rRNA (uracil(1498)-N(3))-methyltransferase [Candidatus Pacebacteria bacterium]|nr:16S rRNA (uracil(1498)-N(3))-methyltransferase [Candidatus Paceibacterota bacterium]MBP9851341.1 16S rRNA (uracil(1498)-N(3))-methyltransferase [Candidatus Paceibacterota bacterium]